MIILSHKAGFTNPGEMPTTQIVVIQLKFEFGVTIELVMGNNWKPFLWKKISKSQLIKIDTLLQPKLNKDWNQKN